MVRLGFLDGDSMDKGKNASESYLFRVKRIGDDNTPLRSILRNKWIDAATAKKQSFIIQCVFGEVSNIDVIEKGLHSPYCNLIEIIFGPKFKNEIIKGNLKRLLAENEKMGKEKKKIELFSLDFRPEYHVIRIDDNILYEDRHPADEKSEWSTAVENANGEDLSALKNYIDSLKSYNPKKIDLSTIDNVGTYCLADGST